MEEKTRIEIRRRLKVASSMIDSLAALIDGDSFGALGENALPITRFLLQAACASLNETKPILANG